MTGTYQWYKGKVRNVLEIMETDKGECVCIYGEEGECMGYV